MNSQWKWVRRWKGGVWYLWETSLPMAAVWLRQKERPGCGVRILAVEDYTKSSPQKGIDHA